MRRYFRAVGRLEALVRCWRRPETNEGANEGVGGGGGSRRARAPMGARSEASSAAAVSLVQLRAAEAEAQQRRACLEQLGILAEITTELESDTWSDAAAATAALSRLVALSTRLAAAREAYASAEAQVEVEGPALTAPALGAEVEAL